MKRVILAAVFIVAINGFAAAQSTSAKQSTQQGKTTVKKGVPVKNHAKHTILKQEASASAKSDSTIKLLLPIPKIPDTTALPVVKKDQEF